MSPICSSSPVSKETDVRALILVGTAIFAAIGFSAIVLDSSAPSAAAQPKPKRTITGLVLDKSERPVVGAMVYLVEPGGPTPDSTTDNAGRYEFKDVSIGASFDVVFSHTQFETALVSRLAPAGNQVIHKTLYKPGEKKASVSDVLDRVYALERLVYYTDAMAEIPNGKLREQIAKDLREKVDPKSISASATEEYENLSLARKTRVSKLVDARVAGLAAHLNR
jgi:hypothetical protein